MEIKENFIVFYFVVNVVVVMTRASTSFSLLFVLFFPLPRRYFTTWKYVVASYSVALIRHRPALITDAPNQDGLSFNHSTIHHLIPCISLSILLGN